MNCSVSICRVRRGWFPLSLWLMASLLSGCSASVQDHLQDYQQRLQRVLETDPVSAGTAQRVARLAVIHNALPLPQADINLLELFSLNQCRIAQAVAQKNSGLGKVAAASQTLVQELAILRDGPDCVQQLQAVDAALAAKLQRALQDKYQQRLHYWWNAWLSGQEWQQFVASAAAPLAWGQPQAAHIPHTLAALDDALLQGQRIAAGDFQPPVGLETQLQQLLLGETLGRWLASQYLLTNTLQQAAALLEQRLALRPLCPTGQPTPQAKILHNVFGRIYAAQVQPYLSLTDRLGNELSDRLGQMTALLNEPPPPAFRQWLQSVSAARQAFKAANLRHVRAWQAALRQCGLMPAAAPAAGSDHLE